ncbi:hypothetical protein GCM10011529_10550 [Polymorphobacter glacialis]|uniref:Histidine phosphotransferase ChpT C-terminal domain-containing protein n=1 Tax=Sandarakinorhabdus glacialis TaxID=1614636 RepID=A0A917E5F1_9SPHN|nr:hypothetical protein [Polymorphobacter glacialis]GGE06070.1 hypothetical protein GCM10011529_10550 [Polymorphobacter glacialis]
MTDTLLAGFIVKWMTHDFASPIATAMTASELLSDTPDAEINGLVQESTVRLAGRLRLVRAALAPGASPIGDAALEKLVRGGLDGTAITWSRSGTDSDGLRAKVIAGSALLLADLRRGQPLTVTDTHAQWETPVALPDAVAAALAGKPATDSRSAVAALLAATAANAGLVLTATADGIAWG